MTTQEKNETGCEEYLYRDMKCCLHPCSVQDCPEIRCVLDFPGGVKSYIRSKNLRELLESEGGIHKAAEKLGVTPQTIERRYNKFKGWLKNQT